MEEVKNPGESQLGEITAPSPLGRLGASGILTTLVPRVEVVEY